VWAILATIFCCVPFGIVAIVYAAQVDGKVAVGDYAGAVATSHKARNWCWISFAVGIVVWVVYSSLVFFGAVTGLIFD
jgi:t-SNARE complex subunit (syntaxin)